MRKIQDLILPARVSMFYSNINNKQVIDVFLESIVLLCGVKAVNLFQKLTEV